LACFCFLLPLAVELISFSLGAHFLSSFIMLCLNWERGYVFLFNIQIFISWPYSIIRWAPVIPNKRFEGRISVWFVGWLSELVYCLIKELLLMSRLIVCSLSLLILLNLLMILLIYLPSLNSGFSSTRVWFHSGLLFLIYKIRFNLFILSEWHRDVLLGLMTTFHSLFNLFSFWIRANLVYIHLFSFGNRFNLIKWYLVVDPLLFSNSCSLVFISI